MTWPHDMLQTTTAHRTDPSATGKAPQGVQTVAFAAVYDRKLQDERGDAVPAQEFEVRRDDKLEARACPLGVHAARLSPHARSSLQ